MSFLSIWRPWKNKNSRNEFWNMFISKLQNITFYQTNISKYFSRRCADKNPYWHDPCADKDSYRCDRR